MRRFLVVALAGLLIAAITAPAFGWEFSMTGQWEYRLRYFGRTGGTDLFGVAALQNSPGAWQPGDYNLATGNEDKFVGFAGPNFYGEGWANPNWRQMGVVNLNVGFVGSEPQWADDPNGAGVRITRGGFSTFGSDAFYNDTALTFYPVITINKALKIIQVIRVGGVRHKYAQYNQQYRIGDIGAGNAGGTLMPNAGVPPFERYYVSQTSMNAVDTAAIASWEQFRGVITTPWTIFSLGVKPFPFGTGMNLGHNTRAETFLAVTPYGPFRFLYAIWLARSRREESWATTPDGGKKNDFFQGAAITYDNGPLSMGWLGWLHRYHVDAGYRYAVSFFQNWGFDDTTMFNVIFLKYNNGRFFANAEYGWLNIDQVFINGGAQWISPQYFEGYNFMVESGFTVGPARLSAAYFLSSGPVWNNSNRRKRYVGLCINEQVLEPYNFLMFNTYGGGNNCPWWGMQPHLQVAMSGARTEGQMDDAYAFAARLDYAVASNLNVWGSYMWAHRLERAGLFGGWINETDSPTSASTPFFAAQVTNLGDASWATHQPYVDDGFIGWEANVGVDWKLLEGLTFNLRYAYWQPGEWFEQAYQAIMVAPATGAVVRNGLLTGRDAINAFEGKLVMDF